MVETRQESHEDVESRIEARTAELTAINAALQAEVERRGQLRKLIEDVSRMREDLLEPGDLHHKLKRITDRLVAAVPADFARIWITQPGDRCDSGCIHAAITEGPHVCRFRDRCLHLVASSGRYTHTDGEVHGRVPFGCYKIGKVASGEYSRFITNEVTQDPRVHDHEWARELGLVSFAGYRLLSADGQPIGVMALFSKRAIAPEEDTLLEEVATTASHVIQTAWAEDVLLSQHAQLLALFDGVDEVLYVADPETYELLYVNSAARQSWGEDIVGKECFRMLQNRDTPCPFCTNHLIFGEYAGRSYVWEFQNQINGRWYQCADKVIQWPDGRMVRFELAADVTPRKQAEESLRQAMLELERSNQELEQFAYVASHDLQEPLRTITSYLQLLERRYGDRLEGNARTYIQHAVDGADRMKSLINALLAYSRLGNTESPFAAVDSNAMIREVLDTMQASLTEVGASVTHDDLPVVWGDQLQLEQVLQNLIGNAVKFQSDIAPIVHVGVVRQNDEWILSVQDNGIGFDPKYADRIFTIFQRLHSRREKPGTGIGLAIVKRIVERHGGRIWAESEPGSGATFYFTLPVMKDEAEGVRKVLE